MNEDADAPQESSSSERQQRRIRQIKSLHIDEVSTVNRGAGRGVQVLLMKGGHIRDFEMSAAITKGLSALQPMAVAKSAVDAVSNAEISEHRFGEPFPFPSMGVRADYCVRLRYRTVSGR